MVRTLMINDGHFNILILGSSIGSFLLGDVIIESLQLLDPSLLAKIRIVQQNNDPICLRQKYMSLGVQARIEKFIDTREEFAKAHLIIGRAGWSLLSDIVATGRASIVIPWTKAKDNHQYHNALWMSEDKLWIMEEHEITSKRVAKVITDLAQDMIEQNFGAETIQHGIIADRARQITSKFSADGGRTIGYFLNKSKCVVFE